MKHKKVTLKDKEKRAEEIAEKLSNNDLWKSHSRPINIDDLKNLKLEIEDFGENPELSNLIRSYYILLSDYVKKNDMPIFVQTRKFS